MAPFNTGVKKKKKKRRRGGREAKPDVQPDYGKPLCWGKGFLGSAVKNPSVHAGDLGSNWIGKIPWRRAGNL